MRLRKRDLLRSESLSAVQEARAGAEVQATISKLTSEELINSLAPMLELSVSIASEGIMMERKYQKFSQGY